MREKTSKVIFLTIIVLCLCGLLNSPIALLSGFLLTFLLGNPFQKKSQQAISYLLKIAVIGLGFGMFLRETIETSRDGLFLTMISIGITLTLGLILARVFGLDKKLGHLITTGTSICGGSAIATISPIIKANSKTISIALGIVFFLNSVALFVFPPLGKLLELTQHQFGLWSAIAIHDTSSVVGAAMNYGEEALRVATTVKLSRTLWIIPLAVISMFMFKSDSKRIKIPWFILGFIAAIILNSSHILPTELTSTVVLISKRLLVLTLFLVGATLSIDDLKDTGIKPMLFAIILWVSISIVSLLCII